MSSDVEREGNTPVIVDCDVLEAAKENIQPLAKGRRVTALSAILSTPHAQRESRLAATRGRLRMNVDLALENTRSNEVDEEGDGTDIEEADPLEAYCCLVYWVVENYPQGHSAESGLLELLEEATRVLKDHQAGKWRGDIRYLKLWVLYAGYVEKPTIIYKFCMVNEIGTSHALLYEEFAIALERAGRKAHADETYRIGIARRAAPPERLETKYKEFQKRMMTSPKLSTGDEPSDANLPPSSTPATTSRRKALGDTGSSRTSTRTTRTSSRGGSSTPSSTPTIPQTIRTQSNARIQVFVDPSPEDTAPPAIADEEETSPWPDLGTRKSRIKENVKEATKIAGSVLRQPARGHRSVSSQSGPKISVYRDPIPEDAEDVQPEDTESREMPPPPVPPTTKARAGKSIAVFREEPEGAPSTKKTKPSVKSSIPVFRDEDSTPSPILPAPSKTSKGKTASKTPISVFRDSPGPAAVPPSRTSKKPTGKSAIAMFRDEEPDIENEPIVAPKARNSKSKSSIPVFRDEPAVEASSSTKAKGKLAIFRDAEPQEASGSSDKKSNGKIAVFRDEPEVPDPPGDATTKAKSKIPVFRDDESTVPSKAKGKIAVFRDEEVTPSFTPYKDEDAPKSPTMLGRTRSLGSGGGIGLGIAGLGPATGRGVKMSSEAEALRKDPLKNYSEDERVLDLD